MNDSELHYCKTWRIRKWLTGLRKAEEGNRLHPTGLSRLMTDHIARDIRRARAELKRRAEAPQRSL